MVDINPGDLAREVTFKNDPRTARQALDDNLAEADVGQLEPPLVPRSLDARVVNVDRTAEGPDGKARTVCPPRKRGDGVHVLDGAFPGLLPCSRS